eukprot:TRINITY_DN64573_c0_g1_i1.p1 TRINITY_DN64573_c0_g1~~TRINITY_DN64573_c0_g1_i1.p1  ORF type:complete len:234 (-),score=46.75 TRINITY_DN64573_c0_g1_i1:125-826(-)
MDTSLSFFASVDAFCLPTADDADDNFGPRLQTMLDRRCLAWDDLPKEIDTGCVEYKSQLSAKHGMRSRVQRLATQMRFRVSEGGGRAFYLIGVSDSGNPAGLARKEHADTIRVVMEAAAMTGNMILLEALSEARGNQRCCSAWSVEARSVALARRSPAASWDPLSPRSGRGGDSRRDDRCGGRSDQCGGGDISSGFIRRENGTPVKTPFVAAPIANVLARTVSAPSGRRSVSF